MKPMICHCMFTWCHWHVLSSWYVVFLNIWLVKFDYLTTTRQYIVIAFRYTFQRSFAEFAQVLGAAMFMINIGGWFVKRGWRQKSLNGKGREILESCFGLPPIMWREQLVAKEFQNLQDYWRGGVYHIALGGRLANLWTSYNFMGHLLPPSFKASACCTRETIVVKKTDICLRLHGAHMFSIWQSKSSPVISFQQYQRWLRFARLVSSLLLWMVMNVLQSSLTIPKTVYVWTTEAVVQNVHWI